MPRRERGAAPTEALHWRRGEAGPGEDAVVRHAALNHLVSLSSGCEARHSNRLQRTTAMKRYFAFEAGTLWERYGLSAAETWRRP